jgi:glutamate-5-semialdehyde dehydrogenase
MGEWTHLEHVPRGFELLVGGDRLLRVPDHVADAFRPGDALLAVERTDEILHVPAAERQIARNAVGRAADAFARMGSIADERISRFFEQFAARLEDDGVWEAVTRVNEDDVAAAKARGRSTTRLVADERLRRGMIDGLRGWIHAPSRRGAVAEHLEHRGWTIDLVGAELGVVAFVFEGRPNVLADATGVLRGGNTVVFRIGRDALGTARAIMHAALEPALAEADLPEGAVVLVDSPAHAAGWALFSDDRLALAVARGSGPAVTTLGSLARQAGVPASLHGTGGAWIVAATSADAAAFRAAVLHSLDRKVCNTLNVCCVVQARAAELVPVLLGALGEAGARRGQAYKLHVRRGDEDPVPPELFSRNVTVRRADGDVVECQAELMEEAELAREWEWEETPEISLAVVESVDDAVDLFNRLSPQFIASLIGADAAEHERFYGAVNAPFVGDGFTRWVDGQLALGRPELGLSNWQFGRLFGRGGVLSGDSVFTLRARVRQSDPDVGP